MTGLLKILWQASSSLFAPGFPVTAGQFDFEILADMDGANALVAHLFEGVLDGFALRVKHGLFWCDNNFCFHANGTRDAARHGGMLSEDAASRQFFLRGQPAKKE